MRREVLVPWLAALRSGRYTQGRNYLWTRDNQTGSTYHCCLGVLCELARAEGVVVLDKDPGTLTTTGRYRSSDQDVDLGDAVLLPTAVVAWAGLEDESPVVAGIELTTRNDGAEDDGDGRFVRPHTFHEIADLLEGEFRDVLTADDATTRTDDD